MNKKKFFTQLKKIKSGIKPAYIKYLSLPVDDKLVLLEGGQGTNINGNMFSMLRELNTNPRWSEYITAFVVTDSTMKAAKNRMKLYGFDKVILVVRDSDLYCRYLAQAKYLLTDNSFPPYFNKREGQVFLNTWHGTPLKTLGKSDKSNLASLANIQKNYLMSDYALFPNEFTRNVFMQDYDLKNIFNGYSLIANYPRNYVFYDKAQAVRMKNELGYKDKRVFAYMPTWRGTGRTADTARQLKVTSEILEQIDSRLDDDTVLLVNLHFLLAKGIDCSSFKHIDYFSSDYDTYEILNACDGLITDYSSVFFDYAVTEKKIILFAYDKEKYLSTRGVYIPFESLPFPIVENVDALIDEMNKPTVAVEDFVKAYCTNGYVNSCEKLFELMVTGKSDCFKLDKSDNKKLCLIYAGNMAPVQFSNLRAYMNRNTDYNYVIAYRRNLSERKKSFINTLKPNQSSLGTVTAFQFTALELIVLTLKRIFGCVKDNSVTKHFFEREKNRLFYSLKPDKIVDFSCANMFIAGVLSTMDGEKEYIVHGDYICYSKFVGKNVKYVRKYEKQKGFKEVDCSQEENQRYIEQIETNMANKSYRINSSMKNLLPLYLKHKNKMICLSMFRLKTPIKVRLKDTWITVGDNEYKPHFIALKNRLSKHHFGIYYFSLNVEEVIDMPAHNMVAINYKNPLGYDVRCHIIYDGMLPVRFLGLRGPIMREEETNTVAIFRQTRRNRLNIYVRSYNESDAPSKIILQILAFSVSLLWHSKKARQLVLLFEKNAGKYEESASALFEKLLDSGYEYSYFIIAKDAVNDVPEKYRKNVLIKNSFKHYLYFFKAKTFIGTETLVHSIDLKTFNKLALAKVADKRKNYVFLQHGVMYMVSLDSESRKMFKRKNLKGKYRVVVSSQAEADHFVELGRHEYEDLYISGLPKFDKNTLNDDADKIVIMPTWRPWEINTARDNFLETSYFKMIMRIFNSVPQHLRDKVIILPHPLIINELKRLPKAVTDTIATDVKYDDILKQARVLITDYSSIAYDAFYRGTRVIFYWEEKDDCMEQYGPTTKLMLNEGNVFGDYFYSTEGLTASIERNYNNPQPKEYIEKYSKIVEFHDGRNTERLIGFLKKDGII